MCTKLGQTGLNWSQPTKEGADVILRCSYNALTWGGKSHCHCLLLKVIKLDMLQLKHPQSRLLPYLPESPVLHYYCSDRGDSSTILGQILLCSGIIFTLELEVLVQILEPELTWHSALQLAMRMMQFIHVDTYFITDYCVFCGINAGLFKWNRIVYRPQHCGRWNHPTQVSSLQKGEECSDRGDSSVLSGQILLCSGIVFALESEVPGSNLGTRTDSALGTSLS